MKHTEEATRIVREKVDLGLLPWATYNLLISTTEELLAAKEQVAELLEVINAAYRGCSCGSDPKSNLIGHAPNCWQALAKEALTRKQVSE